MKFKCSEQYSGIGLLSNRSSPHTFKRKMRKMEQISTSPYKFIQNTVLCEIIAFEDFFPWPTFYRDLPWLLLHCCTQYQNSPRFSASESWKVSTLPDLTNENNIKNRYIFIHNIFIFSVSYWNVLNIFLAIRVGISFTLQFCLLGNLGRWHPSCQ